MAVTIKDVAKRVGVATSTVSRVLKDNPNISEETKRKVRQAIAEMGYVPNSTAQNLASRTTQNIGLILPPFTTPERSSDPFFMVMISEVSQVLNEKGYTATIVSQYDVESLAKTVQQMHQNKRVDGFILMYSLADDPVLNYLLSEDIPFVMLGTPAQYANEIRYIDNDNLMLGRTATQFLLQQGHQRIVFVSPNRAEFVYQERFNGYYLEMKSHHLQPVDQFALENPSDVERFIEMIRLNRPTAMVVSDDLFAVKMIPFLAMQGLKVGENFALISINNSIFSTLSHPYLTTVDIHIKELAEQSAQLILKVLQDDNTPLTKYIIPHQIVVRETTPTTWE